LVQPAQKDLIGIPARTPSTLALGWREALVTREAREFAGLFAEDALFTDVEHRTPDLRAPRLIRGRAEIEAVTRDWLESTPAFRFDIIRILSDATEAAFLWSYEVPGDDGLVAVDGVSWLSCADGLIEEANVLFDSYGFFAGLGSNTIS
jgi:SnoaL-like domain